MGLRFCFFWGVKGDKYVKETLKVIFLLNRGFFFDGSGIERVEKGLFFCCAV